MALVLVLAALALLSFLVVLVLTITRNEDRASKSSADIIEVRTLADLPAQIVISQIRRATSNLGTAYTWASQPGMIRLYASGGTDDAGRAGLYEAYRLYSSPQMVALGADFNAMAEQDAYKDWAASTALFTDLNEPIPLRPVMKSGVGSTASASDKPKLIYPILDPGALELIEGFAVANEAAPGATETQPLPMPAMWLYVLKDGRVISPIDGAESTAKFESGLATETNPIVGRIAFWTDDESCKINLNSASEPAPWDEPRTNSKRDRAYAAFQPAQNEFHRQAGHPAFTALSPVFQSFGRTSGTSAASTNAFSPVPDPTGITTVGPSAFSQNSEADAEKFRDYVESNHRPLPRTVDHTNDRNLDSSSLHGTQPPTDRVSLKGERFFATIDELLFDTERKPVNVSGDGLTLAQTLTEDDVRRARFFLTTHSAAPETNPFNGPKISLWPVQRETGLRTSTDRRMVLAATLSGNPYYWQRDSVWTGASKPGSSQSTSADAGITRNLELIGYLQDLAELPVPGYGGSLKGKYGGSPSNTDQIITSMFDMLRWGVNVQNADEKAGEEYDYLPPGRKPDSSDEPAAEYSAVPMILGSGESGRVKGYGRFPTITEVAMIMAAVEVETLDGKPDGTPKNVDANPTYFDATKKVRVFIALEPFMPAPGAPGMSANVRYRIWWKDKQWTLGGKPLFEAGEGKALTNRVTLSSNHRFGADKTMGGNSTAFTGLPNQFLQKNATPKEVGAFANEDSSFPFVSAEIEVPAPQDPANPPPLEFTGGELVVEIRSADDAAPGTLVQRINMLFPDTKVPMPLAYAVDGSAQWRLFSDFKNRFAVSDQVRFVTASASPQAPKELRQELIQPGDVVRSVELAVAGPGGTRTPSMGDVRALAGVVEATTDWFAPCSGYQDPSVHYVHSLRNGAFVSQAQYGFVEQPVNSAAIPALQTTDLMAGSLLTGVKSPVFLPLALPPGLNGALNADNRPGDWSNGPGLIEDGPYISKPDFGNTENEMGALSPLGAGGYFQRGGDFVSDRRGVNAAPHRQIASAMAFGSLPTGVYPRGSGRDGDKPRPWETLLFCPNPLSRQAEAGAALNPEDHFGFLSPPDHTWLEFFWVPVMEPQPLSPGFSTTGKVNMNTQIMPFTYIQRTTAMHAALRGVRITAIPTAVAAREAGEKHYKNPTAVTKQEFRYPVNATATLKGFDEERFNKGDVFRSASEICEMFLVPKRFGESETGGANAPTEHDYGADTKPTIGLAHNKMIEWWNGKPETAADAFEATGDNARESPYAQLYPRLCTRSNVFQVHYRVQLIKKSRSTEVDAVDFSKDKITAEYRGSTTIERFLDPNDREIPDAATQASTAQALDDHYRCRIISRQPFTP